MNEAKKKRVKHPIPWTLRKLPPSIAKIYRVADDDGQTVDFDSLAIKKRVIRAMNTFDQAREALKLAAQRIDDGLHGRVHTVITHGGDQNILDEINKALAAMEDAGR